MSEDPANPTDTLGAAGSGSGPGPLDKSALENKSSAEIEVLLREQDPKLVQIVQAVVQAEMYSGPTPHPDHLAKYEQTLPGAAAIIFEEFKENSRHQRAREMRQLQLQETVVHFQARDNASTASRDRLALHYAAAVVFFGLIAILTLCYLRFPTVAGVVATSLLVSVVGAILKKESKRKKESKDKADPADAESAELDKSDSLP